MKLHAVNNSAYNQKNYNNHTQKTNKNVSFTGFADSMVSFWRFIDMGGRGYQFTVEDMCGTNFPRTWKGAMSSYKYTGKINVPALAQEALREFLTGPTMTFAPIAILAFITKKAGKTASTHVENITNLSYLADKVKKTDFGGGVSGINSANFEDAYYEEVVRDMLSKSTQNNAGYIRQIENAENIEPKLIKSYDEDVSTLVEGMKKYSKNQAELASAKSKSAKKAGKKQGEEILSGLQETFESIIKRRNPDYKGINFQNARYSIDESAVGETNFKNYIKYATAYTEDYTKKNTADGIVKLNKDIIKKFRKNWSAARVGTIAAMIGLTGLAMSFIPKLYTLASGSINPNAKGVYEEASKKGGK